MLALLLLLAPVRPDIADLDAMARSRDVKGLMEHCGPGLTDKDFEFLQRSGAFGTGRKGWHAYELTDPVGGGVYVVFGTPLTTQDYGDFVFEFTNGKLARLQDERETRGYKVLHCDFKMNFVPEQKRANIVATVRLRRDAAARPSAHLRLSPNYRVAKVTDADGGLLPFDQASGIVSLVPPAGSESKIVLTYSGVVDQPTFAGAIVTDEVMLTNDYWWPHIARQPATVTTTATIPSDWILVTHGKKTNDSVNGDTRTTTYEMDVPISYMSLSAGKFHHEQKKIGRITYHVWSNDMPTDEMREQLDLMNEVVEFYERFAPYPFDDWGAVVTEIYGGGALEAYSHATYGTGWLPDVDSHEPAHTWFGGLLSNTYLNSYWNESFAVYCGGLFGRERPVGNREERRRAFVEAANWQSAYGAAPIEGTGAFAAGLASSLGYGKGALVLQQLEREIGTEKMVAAMQTWIKDNPKGVAAEWSGFERAVSKVTGADQAWFFDQWLRNAQPPTFEIAEIGYVGSEVRGQVDFRGVPHRITTEVYAEMADGSVTHLDVVLNPERKDGISTFRFKLPKKPSLLSFDPYDRILRERPRSDTLKISRVRNMRPVLANKRFVPTFIESLNMARATEQVPADLDGYFLIGHPDGVPAMRDLCRRAGFVVKGDSLTYDGTTIDLNDGAAMAMIDLGNGKVCGIGLGTASRPLEFGNSRVCLVDGRGRFLRGYTEPRKSGSLVFRLP